MGGDMNEVLQFAADPQHMETAGQAWPVLVVDDDAEVLAVTRLMLADSRYEGRRLRLLCAASAAEARVLLAAHPDIALALLDVVMETDHAGLELVRHIRETLGNSTMRLVLRTGQPGLAPVQDVTSRYSIDDYLSKSDLGFQRLNTLITTSLRTYTLLRRLEDNQTRLRRANQDLRQLAYTDPLTGLLNRRLFCFQIEREWRRAMRENRPMSAVMADVDHFKAYNDSYGHPAGDRVLQQVSSALAARVCRAGDALCRYGGEEFLAFYPGSSAEEACRLAGLMRQDVAALGICHASSAHGVVSLSLGCATLEPGPHSDTKGYQQLIELADRALYKAKRAGRNRVECH